jgi:protein-tyrosine phosphatase
VSGEPRLAGAPNFRDLGGHPTSDGRAVRRGVLFRSGVLSDLTDADLDTLASLRVALVVDLRGEEEAGERPDRLPPGVRTLHVPVGDVSAAPRVIAARLAAGDVDGLGAAMLLAGNRAFARERRDGFSRVLRAVMDPAHRPVVLHCTAGKDRAGFAAALVLWMLGVPDDVVFADYLRSNELLAERHERLLRDLAPSLSDVTPLREMLEVRAEYLRAALDAIVEDHGSVDGYLRDGLGIDDAARARFRDDLLEP